MGNFLEAVARFKTKYEVISKTLKISSTNYNSLKELEEASNKLVELEKALGEQKNDEDFLKAKAIVKDHIEEQEEKLLKYAALKEKLESGDNLTTEEIQLKKEYEEKEKREKKLSEFKKEFGLDKEIKNTEKVVSIASYDIDKLSDTLSGKVSVDDMSRAASQIDNGYDQTLRDLSSILTGDESTEYIEGWARVQFGDEMYEAASAIKNGASDAISGVDDFMSLGDTFGGSWRNPAAAAKKIENGLKAIQSAVTKVSTVANNIYAAVTNGKKSELLGKLGNFNSMGIGTASALAGVAGIGIGSVSSFHKGNIGAGIGGIKNSISSVRKAYSDVVAKDLVNKSKELSQLESRLSQEIDPNDYGGTEYLKEKYYDTDLDGKSTGFATSLKQEDIDEFLEEENISHSPNNTTSINGSTASRNDDSMSGGGGNSSDDDFSADMISEINVVLDGNTASLNSSCTINGRNYRLSSYSLSQELLQPMMLSFSLEKEDKIETNSDVVFSDTSNIIGKSLEIHVSTIKTSLDEDSSSQNAFVFKGIIIDVSASRATASTQSASVIVATCDALLQNAPHCRSFENLTLKEIVESVLKPYGDVKSKVSPRFKNKIPYIVQYNQSDYSFISMLAVRFGEWMYNTGEIFVFGELDNSNSSTANLEYPGGSLMSYNLQQNTTSFSFNHVLPNYYQYGQNQAILKQSARGVADGVVHDWTDSAYNASLQRFKNEQIVALNIGGFDCGKEDEGADAILDYSLTIDAQGKKTGVMTVHGYSKLAMLKIGQTFLIRDNVQNKSGENEDVEQKTLKVIGINHSFDYQQEYSNSFRAIPISCNYPSYSNANVFPDAPPQRAKVVENKDEQKLGRVRVQFPWQEIQSKEMKTPWLRIAVPYAGASKGLQFVPEIGEEVMVGFEMNNAERPYIMGSFYNGGNGKPDENWAVSKEEDGTTNNIKAIRTRNGHTILFNDKGDAGLLEIYDNKNNTYHITLSADDKKITIYSAGDVEVVAKNNINVSADGNIDVIAKGDIGVNADGDIGIKSKGNISMEAKKEVSIQASKVKVR
ncbi:MAG: hypothetical protein J6K81_05395 [Rikenellaceae bacterium]|nr:hypothetical protein [Rikenellaceae bacterium]